MFNFNQTTFYKSALLTKDFPLDSTHEVAFLGRSNCGKSTMLNTLTNTRGLAKTSKTPGRTQLVNFFEVVPEKYLVDLPGYGYAQASLEMKQKWQKHLENYLINRNSLAGLVLLMDIRHPLKALDQHMINWCIHSKLPIYLVLTKADKMKRGAAKQAMQAVQLYIEQQQSHLVEGLQLFSALHKIGIDTLSSKVSQWLNIHIIEKQ